MTCNENTYDPNTSGWFSFVEEGYEYKLYGSFVKLVVRQVQDQICMLSFNNCIQPFNWLLINEQEGLPPQVDGILGLTQGRTPAGAQNDLPEDFNVGPLWLDHIYDQGYITERQFSTHFEGFDGRSYIDFGQV